MQTNPLYVSQLARHIKLPLYWTVQDYTEELLRCRTTLPPQNSMFAKRLYIQAKGVVDLSSASKSLFQFERAEKSQKRSKAEVVEVGALNIMGTHDQTVPRALPPGITSKLIFYIVPPGSLVRRRWPAWTSCARTTDSASSRRQHWSAVKLILELEPFNADHQTTSPHTTELVITYKTAYKRLAEVMPSKESIFNATNTLKPCYTLYLKDFSPLQLLWGSICYLQQTLKILKTT